MGLLVTDGPPPSVPPLKEEGGDGALRARVHRQKLSFSSWMLMSMVAGMLRMPASEAGKGRVR